MTTKNINKLFVSALAILVLVPAFAFGATLKAGEEVYIKKGNNIQDNLYIAGGSVSVSGIVFGDLFAAGGNILISENVSEDITVVGGTITILGDSGGDVRVAGGNVLIVGDVKGDLIITGGSLIVSSDVLVGKDLVIAGGQVSVDGDVAGDVQIVGGVVTINGHIKGNVKAKINDKLTIGDGAIIDGNLEYSARNPDSLKLSETAIVTGETVYKKIKSTGGIDKNKTKNFIFAVIGAFVLFKLISFIIVALLFFWLFRNFSNSVVKGVVQNPLQMLGKGFVVLVVAPIASVLLFVTLFGAPLGFMVMLSYVLLLFISGIYAGVVVGAWVSQVIRKSDNAVITWKNVIGGIVLLTIVKFVPLVGWIIGLFVFLVTLGSIVDMVYKKLWRER